MRGEIDKQTFNAQRRTSNVEWQTASVDHPLTAGVRSSATQNCMKTTFVLVVFFASSLTLFAGDKTAAIEREKTLWQAVQDKKLDVFRKYFADDYRAVYGEGIFNLAQEMAAVAKTDLKSFSLADTNVVFPNENTAVLSYKVAAQGTQEGKDMSGVYYCGSVWHKRGNDWKAVFHTEIVPQPQK